MPSYSLMAASPYDEVITHAQQWGTEHPEQTLFLYALVDAGQDKNAYSRLSRHSIQQRSLLNTQDRAADAFSPQLLDLGAAVEHKPELAKALSAPYSTTAFTLLCSTLPTADLHQHLAQFIEVRLTENVEMLLAIWDPAILGTLVGNKEDDSLHVSGPVLSTEQTDTLLAPVVAWWYCDRETRWHRIASPTDIPERNKELRLTFTQEQEDMLVEASVPDQVLYHLEVNQPHLFEAEKTHAMRYGFVKSVLWSARHLGLTGMRDLVNFTALCLIYRRRMQTDPAIAQLLDQVQQKVITLDQALPLMPE
jgi:hypothetical protein